MKTLTLTMSLLLLLAVAITVTAGDETKPAAKEGAEMMAEGQMPEMGAPEELKEMAHMIGDWTVSGKMRMDPATEEWTEYTGTTSYEWISDGAALMSTYKAEMFGMPFVGNSIETYDRETKMWQTTWVDNMAARQSMYTGSMVGEDKMVFTGEDKMMGDTFKTRITIANMTDTAFDWMLEHSMDGGATWIKFMDATYTKKM